MNNKDAYTMSKQYTVTIEERRIYEVEMIAQSEEEIQQGDEWADLDGGNPVSEDAHIYDIQVYAHPLAYMYTYQEKEKADG